MQLMQYFAAMFETNANSQRASDNKDCRSCAAPGRITLPSSDHLKAARPRRRWRPWGTGSRAKTTRRLIPNVEGACHPWWGARATARTRGTEARRARGSCSRRQQAPSRRRGRSPELGLPPPSRRRHRHLAPRRRRALAGSWEPQPAPSSRGAASTAGTSREGRLSYARAPNEKCHCPLPLGFSPPPSCNAACTAGNSAEGRL